MKVKVLKPCHCVRRFKFDEEFEYYNREVALKKAEEIIEIMNKKSCQSHEFSLNEKDDGFEISSKINYKSW
ncbi:hypothetical protein [Arcobacter sp. F2176]|uniref:hypothetical protein n=1 Tax=unclassified Arcobacter TaxID=2593671 RepID=UPI00100A53E2|nr:hypothetical protein [Arcobacter sp. F2176]RXJ79595.1 hypothetical protein CRU95_13525 [Arcobacter sp. F2176]